MIGRPTCPILTLRQVSRVLAVTWRSLNTTQRRGTPQGPSLLGRSRVRLAGSKCGAVEAAAASPPRAPGPVSMPPLPSALGALAGAFTLRLLTLGAASSSSPGGLGRLAALLSLFLFTGSGAASVGPSPGWAGRPASSPAWAVTASPPAFFLADVEIDRAPAVPETAPIHPSRPEWNRSKGRRLYAAAGAKAVGRHGRIEMAIGMGPVRSRILGQIRGDNLWMTRHRYSRSMLTIHASIKATCSCAVHARETFSHPISHTSHTAPLTPSASAHPTTLVREL